MEAYVKKSHRSFRPDEMNVKRGTTIKILTGDEKPKWHWAEYKGRLGYVPTSCVNVLPRSWFKGDLSREEARLLLLKTYEDGTFVNADGTFILRYSQKYPSRYAISVKYDGDVSHYLVDCNEDGRYKINGLSFFSLNKMIEYYEHVSFLPGRRLNLKPLDYEMKSAPVDPESIHDETDPVESDEEDKEDNVERRRTV
ncbi:hypothetical protein ACOME3_000776 [Neoechinorhynchus agilis]